MDTLITILHVIVSLILVLSVLLQSGKGGMGAAFGGGSSTGAVFGGSGAGGFLRKLTVGAAVIFMLTSMTLAWLASNTGTDALKRYSAQQRRAKQLKDAAKRDALSGADSTDAGALAPDKDGDDQGGMSTPDDEAGGDDTKAGDTDTKSDIATKPADTKPGDTKPGDTKPGDSKAGAAVPKPAPASVAPKTGPPATKKPAAEPATPAAKPAPKKPAPKKPAAAKPAAKQPAGSAPSPK